MRLNHASHEGFTVQLCESGALQQLSRKVSHLIHLLACKEVSNKLSILHQEVLQSQGPAWTLIRTILFNHRKNGGPHFMTEYILGGSFPLTADPCEGIWSERVTRKSTPYVLQQCGHLIPVGKHFGDFSNPACSYAVKDPEDFCYPLLSKRFRERLIDSALSYRRETCHLRSERPAGTREHIVQTKGVIGQTDLFQGLEEFIASGKQIQRVSKMELQAFTTDLLNLSEQICCYSVAFQCPCMLPEVIKNLCLIAEIVRLIKISNQSFNRT